VKLLAVLASKEELAPGKRSAFCRSHLGREAAACPPMEGWKGRRFLIESTPAYFSCWSAMPQAGRSESYSL